MILVAIGANLAGPQGQSPAESCRAAAAALAGLPGLRLVAVSPWFETAPVSPSEQPNYVNGLARLEGWAKPEALLAALHVIESRFGRMREARNAARTLDLDLIAIDDLVRATPPPVLPHPRAHLRAFVLVPLCAVAPEWRHPLLGKTAAELLAGIGTAGVRPLLPLQNRPPGPN